MKNKPPKDPLKLTPAEVTRIVPLAEGNLHYWERLKLVSSCRNENNTRYYTPEQVDQIKKLYQEKYVKI